MSDTNKELTEIVQALINVVSTTLDTIQVIAKKSEANDRALLTLNEAMIDKITELSNKQTELHEQITELLKLNGGLH